MIDPNKDGVDHINIYSRGKKELGRLLSNFAYTPTVIDGQTFASLEGYWYWLSSAKNKECEVLKTLYGFKAKQVGRELRIPDWPTTNRDEFEAEFKKGMRAKLEQHPEIQELLEASTLPFAHYYVYGDTVKEVEGCEWMLAFWEELRRELKESGNG